MLVEAAGRLGREEAAVCRHDARPVRGNGVELVLDSVLDAFIYSTEGEGVQLAMDPRQNWEDSSS